MNLYIRSQDKENLVPIDKAIQISDIKEINKIAKLAGYDFMDKEFDDIDGINFIRDIVNSEGYSLITDDIKLGIYKTKERALEILDEIQNILKNSQYGYKVNGLGEKVDIIPNQIFVYEMPKE